MFVDPCVIMMLLVTIIYTGAIRILGTKQKRSKVVAGSANQYNIAPTQTILSLRFFEPKLRRIVLILALLLTIQSRNLTSNTDRVTILTIYTSLKMKRRDSNTALYKWLIRRHTKIWHDLLLGVWTLTHWRTQWKRIKKKRIRKRKQQARKAHRGTPSTAQKITSGKKFSSDYTGDGPTHTPDWQGDDMEIASDETRLTKMTFINADGIAQPTSILGQKIITDKGLDTVASIAEMLEWQSTIIGIGDAQTSSETGNMALQTKEIWKEARWVKSRQKGRKAGTPGGTIMGIDPKLKAKIIHTYELESEYGWFTGVLLQGKKRAQKSSDLAIITVYCPLYNKNGGAWSKIHADLRRAKSPLDPTQKFFQELTDIVKKLHDAGTKIIIGGDFNIEYDKAHSYSTELTKLLREGGLEHTLSIKHPNTEFTTYINSEKNNDKRTCPDAVYVSQGMTQQCITRTGVCMRKILNSQHRAIVIEVDLLHALGQDINGDVPALPSREKMTPRILTHENTADLKKYTETLETKRDMLGITAFAREIRQGVTKTKMELNEMMEIIEHCMTDAEQALRPKQGPKSAKRPDISSPELVARAVGLRRTYHLIRMIRKMIEEDNINTTYIHNTWNRIPVKLMELPAADTNEKWAIWVETLTKKADRQCKDTTTTWRKEQREQISEGVQKRDKLFDDNKIKRFIRRILGGGASSSGTELIVRDKQTGAPRIITDPTEIKESETAVMEEWMGLGRSRWFISKSAKTTDHPTLADTDSGKETRKKLQYDTEQKDASHWGLPMVFNRVFQAARVKMSNLSGKQMNMSMYGDIMGAVTWEEYEPYIRAKQKNTAPGESGVRYAHIAYAPVEMQQDLLTIMNEAFKRRHVFNSWKKELIYRTEKEPGNPDQMNKRPLKLQNVMRKMWIGILKNRMVRVWYKHGVINEDQHAFLRGKSTAQPIYLRKFILEDAVNNNKFVGLTDIDLARAYDQTERWVKEMSFRRFGVPEELIAYFGLLDTDNKNYVLTAYGPGREFEALMGAYAQGDDLSPLGWVCTMDWKLCVCATGSKDPYVVNNGNGDRRTFSRTIFADDGTYLQGETKLEPDDAVSWMKRAFSGGTGNVIRTTIQYKLRSMQHLIDSVELFCGCTGHEIKTKKSHILILEWIMGETNEAIEWTKVLRGALKIRRWRPTENKWTPELGPEEDFPVAMPSDEKRHLGHYQDAYGGSNEQKKTLKHEVLSKTNRISLKHINVLPTRYICQAVIFEMAAYKLRFMNVSARDIADVEAGVKALMTRRSGVHSSVPDDLKYGTRGGMAWEPWGDKINIRRLTDLMTIIREDGGVATLMRGELKRLHMWVGSAKHPMTLPTANRCAAEAGHRPLWSMGLWQWMMNPNRELTLKGEGIRNKERIRRNDFSIQESKLVRDGDTLRIARWRWKILMASDILCRDGKTLLPKWWIDQEIHKRDPAGWREIMIATNAVLNKMQKVGNIQMDKLPITPESIVSVTDGEEVMIGKVISITQDRIRVQKLVEDTSSKDKIRKTCKDIGSWIQTCRLLNAPGIRLMRRTNEYVNVDKGYALAMDHVLMPKSIPATNIKQVGDKRKNDENEFLGRIAQRVGKFWDPQNNGRAKTVHECMIMETDREIEAVHAQNLRHMRDMEAGQTDSPTATQRTRKANLINKVPTERASSIPLAKHRWEIYKTQGYRLWGGSDGSGEKNDGQSGAYGWVIIAENGINTVVLDRGWGWEDIRANSARGLIDSTRMELAGIAAGITYALDKYPNEYITWYCDNESAVNEIPKIKHRSTRQWLAACNTDIGEYLADLPRAKINKITVVWKRGHPEDRMETHEYALHDRINVCVDDLASAVPHTIGTCCLHKLPGQPPIRVRYHGQPIVNNISKTIMKYIQTNYTLNYTTQRPEWIQNDTLDWRLYDQWNARIRSPTRRADNMKLLWDKYLTNERLHSHMNIGDGMCRCGREKETSSHMILRCGCVPNEMRRQRMISRIAKYHQDLADTGEITGKWAKFMIKLYNVNEEGKATEWSTNDIPEWLKTIETKQELSPANATALTKWLQNGSEVVWKGIFPPQIADIAQDMGMSRTNAAGWADKMRDMLLEGATDIWKYRCKEVHDTTDKVEEESVKQKRDLIEALWKEIGDARQRGTPEGEITAVDRSGVDEIMAPRLSKHIKLLRAHLHSITAYPTVAVSHVPERNDMVEYNEADTETMNDMDANKKLTKDLTVTDIRYYSERAKSELHLTDMKSNTKMRVTARPMFRVAKKMKNKLPNAIQNDIKTYLLTPEYGYRSTSEHMTLHMRINITEAEYKKQTENIPYSAPYKFRTKITVDEYDIKMPCGIRSGHRNLHRKGGVANSTNKRNEAKENIVRARARSRMAQDRTRMERKRKQAMLKKKKQTKTSTKDAMDKANIKRKNIRSWDEMTSGNHEAGGESAPRGANTNDYEEAIKRILRRADTEAPHGASYKTKKNSAVRRALNKKSTPEQRSRTARGIRTLHTNFSTATGGVHGGGGGEGGGSYSATPDAADERNAPHGATLVDAIGRDGSKKYTRHMTQRQSNTDNTTADRGRGDSETEQRLEHEPSSDHDMGNPE